jgi:hypothetical protein
MSLGSAFARVDPQMQIEHRIRMPELNQPPLEPISQWNNAFIFTIIYLFRLSELHII